MTIKKAVAFGLAGNELSKVITGSSEVSPNRTIVATGSGALISVCATSAVTLTVGVVAAPVALPLAVTSGLVAAVASLFD